MIDAPTLVVQLEFAGQPRGESFRDLQARLGSLEVRQIDPVSLPGAPEEFSSLADRVDRLLAAAGPATGAPVVLQAYCTGTTLAAAAGERLLAAGHQVKLIQLFNPEAVTAAHVAETFCELADKLGSPHERSEAMVRSALASTAGRAEQLRRLSLSLREVGTEFALSLGVPEEDAPSFSGELIDRYCAWLNYLVAALDAPFPPVPSVVRVYATRECPAIGGLREAKLDLVVKTFDPVDGAAMTDAVLLETAVADLFGHAAGGPSL